MKEIRPSTWILLGILALIIFAPAFFLNVDDIRDTMRHQGDNSIHPMVPTQTKPEPKASKPANNAAPDNTPPGNAGHAPPGNGGPMPAGNYPEAD